VHKAGITADPGSFPVGTTVDETAGHPDEEILVRGPTLVTICPAIPHIIRIVGLQQ